MHCYIHSSHDISKIHIAISLIVYGYKTKEMEVSNSLDHVNIETHGDLLIHHFKNPPNDVILCSHHTTIFVRLITIKSPF